MTDLKRVSKPGRRVTPARTACRAFSAAWARRSCPHRHGLVTGRTAQERGVGGEVICFVW